MRIMDRRSKMPEIKLVSKYYPVANYSYPSPLSPTSPTSGQQLLDRCSVGSDGSAPGLVDDRTDSEVSQEDDYQSHHHHDHHALWNSFWQAGGEWRLEAAAAKPGPRGPVAARQEPTPSCRHRKQTSQQESLNAAAAKGTPWPLPTPTPASSSSARKPAATYSAFPSLKPAPQVAGLVPAPLSPRSPSAAASPCTPPPRPRRPEALLTPCLRQPVRSATVRAPSPPVRPPPPPPRAEAARPKTSSGPATHRPRTSGEGHHARSRSNVLGIHGGAASRSSEDLAKAPLPAPAAAACCEPQHHGAAPRHHKSMTYLGAARHHQQQQLQLEQAEPHSVFEDDSDCEEEPPAAGRSFFKFHKRSASDKSYKGSTFPAAATARAGAAAQDAALLRKRRNRADTIPAPAAAMKSPASERERKVDLFGRMLGRRSR